MHIYCTCVYQVTLQRPTCTDKINFNASIVCLFVFVLLLVCCSRSDSDVRRQRSDVRHTNHSQHLVLLSVCCFFKANSVACKSSVLLARQYAYCVAHLLCHCCVCLCRSISWHSHAYCLPFHRSFF